MKNLAIALVAVLVILGGYTLFKGPGEDDIREGVAENAAAAEAQAEAAADKTGEALSDAGQTVGAAASDAADAVSDVANDAVEATGDALNAAGAAIGDAVEGAKNSAQELTQDAAIAADKAEVKAEAAADAAAEKADAAGDAIAEGANDAGRATIEALDNAAAITADALGEATDGDLVTTTRPGEVAEEATEGADMDAETAAAVAGTDKVGLEQLLTVEGFDFAQVQAIIDGSNLNPMQKTTLDAALTQAQDNPEALRQVLAQMRSALDL